MFKKAFFLLLTVFAGFSAHSQSADTVYNRYLDFNLARFQGEEDKVLALGERVLPDAEKLPEKSRINFYFSIGKVYEDNDQPAKAVIYYEKVTAAVPNYYVVHRALGYLYLDDVKAIEKKLNEATSDAALNKSLTEAYYKAVKKALPHLEKAQACDPSEETLAIIQILYKNIKDLPGLNSLNDRLKQLSTNCIDILAD